ncbi:rhodanese-like domain-containing protein [Blastochloris viridis]|uniref:Putative adenylyltransferase/sulfurtransferase MoeZ n=1 Tax=Blastochloris viridis TaxID=1079 RepID=A0A0H5B6W7_BLAVI|nr:rhodanese-like domain-containing protein [Blastochloris viridis]ALK08809.1 putative adenylyltransferase/sulfurtransferase MoeZ [Blastochloris viridis]BAR97892.1 rhodanese-related sulfurtransferase [Blastochloris viridis]CUU41470.1 putative adenylyltransferase/sulfurtransferase MoeZ [Blastochloris viridis]
MAEKKSRRWVLGSALVVVGVSAFVLGPAVLEIATTPANLPSIDRAQLEQALAANAVDLIDIREPDEYAAGHIAGARNLPMSKLDPKTLAMPSDKPVVLVCRSGRRTAQTLAAALEAGATNIVHYPGAMLDWTSAGKPVVKGQ